LKQGFADDRLAPLSGDMAMGFRNRVLRFLQLSLGANSPKAFRILGCRPVEADAMIRKLALSEARGCVISDNIAFF
jgi:hypothetical protein